MLNTAILLAISIAWASEYLFIGQADTALPPLTVSAATTAIAAAVLIVVVRGVLRRPLLPFIREHRQVPLIMAVTAIALPKLSVVVAEDRITSDLASLVGTTVPILTLAIGIFVTRQTRFSPYHLAGTLIALSGLLVFVGLGNLVSAETELVGALIMMSGGVSFAINGVYGGLKARTLDPYVLTTWVLILGAVGLSVAAFLLERDRVTMPDTEVLVSLAGSGALSTGLAYIGYYALLARSGAGFTSLYAYLVPPFGVLSAVVVLGHPLTAQHVMGVLLTLVGLWVLTGPERRARRSEPASAEAE